MPISAEKLNTQPARHLVADRIRESILDGSLQPGERLVERKLADTLGVSQSAIREALIQLELEGHVTKKPNSATYVTHLSQRELENTIAVRRALEAFAVEEAASHATPADVARLEELYDLASAAAQAARVAEIHPPRPRLGTSACGNPRTTSVSSIASGASSCPCSASARSGWRCSRASTCSTTCASIARCSTPSKAGEPERARRAFNTAMNDWARTGQRSLHRGAADGTRRKTVVTALDQLIPSSTAETQARRNSPLRVRSRRARQRTARHRARRCRGLLPCPSM